MICTVEETTYGKFSNLSVVHSEDFSFFAGAEVKAGDEVDAEENDARSAKGISEARKRVCELVSHLRPVSIEPAACNDCAPIKMCYVVTAYFVSIWVECQVGAIDSRCKEAC